MFFKSILKDGDSGMSLMVHGPFLCFFILSIYISILTRESSLVTDIFICFGEIIDSFLLRIVGFLLFLLGFIICYCVLARMSIYTDG